MTSSFSQEQGFGGSTRDLPSHSNMLKFNRNYPTHSYPIKKEVEDLTICIAAICENNKEEPKIIYTSDTKLTGSWITVMATHSKVFNLTDYCKIMVSSNNISKSDMIVHELKEQIGEATIPMKQIAMKLVDVCTKYFHKSVEKDVLEKYHLSYETFINKSKDLADELVRTIEEEIRSYIYQFSTDFIVLGIDITSGTDYFPHLYVVNQDREVELQDFVGFAIIGSGQPLALSEMATTPYDANCSYNEALLKVFLSKKESERVSTVGEETHLFIMTLKKDTNGIFYIEQSHPSDDAAKILNTAFQESRNSKLETYEKYVKELDNLKNTTVNIF